MKSFRLYSVRTEDQLIETVKGIKKIAEDFECKASKKILTKIDNCRYLRYSKNKMVKFIMILEEIAEKADDFNRELKTHEYHDFPEFFLAHDINVILNPCAYDVEMYYESSTITPGMFDLRKIESFWAGIRT
jgi:hypothetical protein